MQSTAIKFVHYLAQANYVIFSLTNGPGTKLLIMYFVYYLQNTLM
jgi:hypothetical protein